MKRTPLKRKTPLKRGTTPLKRTKLAPGANPLKRSPLARISKRQVAKLNAYGKAKAAYLNANPFCEACLPRGAVSRFRSTDIHHSRGRAGELLSDTRFFKALCRPCHDWTHENPGSARALGLLAPANEWNTPPGDEAAA